jgi:AcrR family transcriptional regulator
MDPKSRREKLHEATREEIIEIAWNQIAEKGAAAFSLRGIARRMGLTAPALYRYFEDRDALVTALIVEAFTSLGEHQRAAFEQTREQKLPLQLYELGIAYRGWAVTYPQRYQLIFGTPIPGYEAPKDTTIPAAAWSLMPLIESLQALYDTGRLRAERNAPLTVDLQRMLDDWSDYTGVINPEVLYTALIIWSRVHGLCLLEIGGQMPSFITDPGEIYRREMNNIQNQYIGEAE